MGARFAVPDDTTTSSRNSMGHGFRTMHIPSSSTFSAPQIRCHLSGSGPAPQCARVLLGHSWKPTGTHRKGFGLPDAVPISESIPFLGLGVTREQDAAAVS